MEIDLTHEVSGRGSAAPRKPYDRRLVMAAAALAIGLVAGAVGVTIGRRSNQGGSVTLAHAALTGANHKVRLQWSLANFSSEDAQVRSVLVDEMPVAIESPIIIGRSITEFTTPLRCGDEVPQLTITLTDGDGQRNGLGYLVDKGDWTRLCG
ncbi:hypothetical protein [Actinoplanes sp. URMC 104]|uniref:hypothetical protein n=1 Tax=Actinoplanes sp. URMC 104 TaxID=3423409 RepID=UPI003F1AE799